MSGTRIITGYAAGKPYNPRDHQGRAMATSQWMGQWLRLVTDEGTTCGACGGPVTETEGGKATCVHCQLTALT